MTNIQGLQKLSLLDYPGKVACTIFTGGCNLRCPFCHNASLVLSPQESQPLQIESLLSFLTKRRGVLDGVCISGGEPLLQADLADLIREIRSLGYAVKLDTNGCFPDRLAALIGDNLLDYVAMDIKNAPQQYAQTVGIGQFDPTPVLASATLLMQGAVDYEFRTTVVRGLHDENSFQQIGQWLAGAKKYYLQQFVDSGNLIAAPMSGFEAAEMKHFLAIVRDHIPAAQLRGI